MRYKYLKRDDSLYKEFPLGTIYKATNTINNKSYVGQTVEKVNSRRLQHLRESKNSDYKFYRALRKYEDNLWDWSIVHIIQEGENIDKLEIEYIKKYDSYYHGYNSTLGGQYLNRKELEKELSVEELNFVREKRKLNCKNSFAQRWNNFSEEEKEEYRMLRSGKNSGRSKYVYWIFDKDDNFLYEVINFSKFCREHQLNTHYFSISIDKSRSYNGWEVLKVDYRKMDDYLSKLTPEEKLQFQLSRMREYKQKRKDCLNNRGEIRTYKIFQDNILIIEVKKFKYLEGFCKENNLNYATFRSKLYKDGSYKGFRLEIEEYQKSRMKDLKLNIVDSY
jgi:hypothetical protein